VSVRSVRAGWGRCSAAAPGPEAMNSPTITSPALTQDGMILGTAADMAVAPITEDELEP